MPAYVLAYAYADLLQFAGPVQSALRLTMHWERGDYWFPEIQSLGGAIFLFVVVFYPYVYALARIAFLEQSGSALEASRSLGRGPWQSFWLVALPLARPAIAGGTALALMETLADFGAVQHLAVDTFTTGIYRTWFGLGAPIAAAQLSASLVGCVALVLTLERFLRGGRWHSFAAYRPRQRRLADLTGAAAFGACLLCLFPILAGFALPAMRLLYLAGIEGDRLFGARFIGLAGNSAAIAGAAALVAVAAAIVIGYAVRLRPTRTIRTAARISGLGYAMPGSIVAVGALIPFAALDNAIDAFARASFGVSTGLILSGTLVALLFAYVVRFLAVASSAIDAGFARIRPNLDNAARSLGARPLAALFRLHLPLLRGSLSIGALLVFVEALKELPATMIVRPFGFNTLAVRVYELASDERLAEASSAALAIVAVGLVPVIVLSRRISGGAGSVAGFVSANQPDRRA
jgi:iron(III) transport system permease protein